MTQKPLATEQVQKYHETLCNWGRWGDRDQLGTPNLITPQKRVAAARLVDRGRSVSCARPLPRNEPAPSNKKTLAEVPGIVSVHDLHVWSMVPGRSSRWS